MKHALLAGAGVLAIGLITLMAVAAGKPATFRIERMTTIAAPADKVYANIDDFHRWSAWQPWETLDPHMSKRFKGPERGQGAVYEWQGNKEVGKGRMTIIEARPNQRVVVRLEFLEPFPADNRAIFTLVPKAGATEVSWAMEGPNSFMGKVISVFVDMDEMLGGDFQRGLANLKELSEAAQ
jgi:uncharacterized protein YndB with AHSA1/START domain